MRFGFIKKEEFQSAPPVKGATQFRFVTGVSFVVSIRAPREGGDGLLVSFGQTTICFNPRPP